MEGDACLLITFTSKRAATVYQSCRKYLKKRDSFDWRLGPTQICIPFSPDQALRRRTSQAWTSCKSFQKNLAWHCASRCYLPTSKRLLRPQNAMCALKTGCWGYRTKLSQQILLSGRRPARLRDRSVYPFLFAASERRPIVNPCGLVYALQESSAPLHPRPMVLPSLSFRSAADTRRTRWQQLLARWVRPDRLRGDNDVQHVRDINKRMGQV